MQLANFATSAFSIIYLLFCVATNLSFCFIRCCPLRVQHFCCCLLVFAFSASCCLLIGSVHATNIKYLREVFVFACALFCWPDHLPLLLLLLLLLLFLGSCALSSSSAAPPSSYFSICLSFVFVF